MENFRRIKEIYLFVRALGVNSWKVTTVEPIGSAKKHSNLFLMDAEILQLLRYIKEWRNDNKLPVSYGCSHFLPSAYDNAVRNTPFCCGAGTFIASVSAAGDILPCLDIDARSQAVQGNIMDNSFWNVWNNRFQIFRENKALKSEYCNGCEYIHVCQGDSWHTWDFEKQRSQMCLRFLE